MERGELMGWRGARGSLRDKDERVVGSEWDIRKQDVLVFRLSFPFPCQALTTATPFYLICHLYGVGTGR